MYTDSAVIRDYSHSHLQYRPINMSLRDLLADLLNTFVIRSYRPIRYLLLWSDAPLMFCQTVNVLFCIKFKAVRKPFSKQITAGMGWIITYTLFRFNIYVEIEKYPYMTGTQTGLLTILTEMLTISGLWCDMLDRNSPITPLVCWCFDRIPNTLLIPSGHT